MSIFNLITSRQSLPASQAALKQVNAFAKILLAEDASPIDAVTELLLLFAARAQHLEEVIYPALRQNKWVLCDRFTDASYAYQGGGRGVSVSKIQNIESAVQGGFGPDLTLLLTGDIKKGMQRVSRRVKKIALKKSRLVFLHGYSTHMCNARSSTPHVLQ